MIFKLKSGFYFVHQPKATAIILYHLLKMYTKNATTSSWVRPKKIRTDWSHFSYWLSWEFHVDAFISRTRIHSIRPGHFQFNHLFSLVSFFEILLIVCFSLNGAFFCIYLARSLFLFPSALHSSSVNRTTHTKLVRIKNCLLNKWHMINDGNRLAALQAGTNSSRGTTNTTTNPASQQ